MSRQSVKRSNVGRTTIQFSEDVFAAGYQLIRLGDASSAHLGRWGALFGPAPNCRWGLLHIRSETLCYQAQTLVDLKWRWRHRAAQLLGERRLLDDLRVRCNSASPQEFDRYVSWAADSTKEAPVDLPISPCAISDEAAVLPRHWRKLALELHCESSTDGAHFFERIRSVIADAAALRLEEQLPKITCMRFRRSL